MDEKSTENLDYLSISSDENAGILKWSLSSSLHDDASISRSTKHSMKCNSFSVSANYRKQVSFAETTALVEPESSTLIVSYSPKETSAQFVNVRPLRKSQVYKTDGLFDMISTSIISVGRMSLSVVRHRAVLQSLSLPDIPSDDRRTSTAMSALNLLGMSYGTSTLALPFIVGRTGLAGIAAIIILGLLSLYTSLLLVDCQYDVSKSNPQGGRKRIYRNIIDIGMAILPARIGGPFIKSLIVSSLLSDVYVFILMGNTTVQLTHEAITGMNYQHWILVWVALLLPFFGITRVSILAWISFTSLVTFMIAVVLIYVVFFGLAGTWSLTNIPSTVQWDTFLVGYGIILNSYNLQWYVPAVEGSMAKPEEFTKMISFSLTINTILKTLFGLFGGLSFGLLAKQSITENLSTSNPALFKSVSLILMCSLYFYFPMGLFVVFEMFDLYFKPYFPILDGGGIKKVIWLMLSRSLVLTTVVLLAVSFSQFGFVVGIIGSVRGTLVAVVFPCAAHLKLKWKQLSFIAKLVEVFVVVICLTLSCGGTYYSIKGLVGGVE